MTNLIGKNLTEVCQDHLLPELDGNPNRPGLVNTPARFHKAWKELTRYRDLPARAFPELSTTFEKEGMRDKDGEPIDDLVVISGARIYSMCEHHLLPFFGVAHVGYISKNKVIGLSKIARLVDFFSRRLQVQERLTEQVATELQEIVESDAVGVVTQCRHMCMEMRGVSQPGIITTCSSIHGILRNAMAARSEFMSIINESKHQV